MVTAWESSAWVDVAEETDGVALRVRGELNVGSCLAIEPAIVVALASCAPVTIDLTNVTFCDSHALALFITARQIARSQGTRFEISGASPPVRRLFEVTGIDKMFEVDD
jgi:anti-sigma B factor antagonist